MNIKFGGSVLYIKTKDVGCTQEASIYIGDTCITKFKTCTRHQDVSLKTAEGVVKDIFLGLLNNRKSELEERYGVYLVNG